MTTAHPTAHPSIHSTLAPAAAPLDPNVALFNSRRVRSAGFAGETYFAAVDVVGRLSDAEDRGQLWRRLRDELALQPVHALFEDAAGVRHELEGLKRGDVLRLASALTSHAARRIQAWMAERAIVADGLMAERKTEQATQRSYDRRGKARPWIERRQSGKSVRRELAGQWARRGASESEQYRLLTNALFASTFGVDVAGYRQQKRLDAGANLRDHMNATELTLTTLAETLAAQLLVRRDVQGFEAVLETTQQAGRVAAEARSALEALFGDFRTNGDRTAPGPRAAA